MMSAEDPVARLAESRRSPIGCLYCSRPPNSDEHIVPEAVGGRLTARILCREHNNALGKNDKAFAEHYATLTFATNVQRQRGKRGTSVRFVDAEGRRTSVNPDGRSEFGLHSVERNEAGVVQRAQGALAALEGIAKGHPDPNGFRLFEVVGPGVAIPIAVGVGPESLPGFLKTALHFAAGFVAEPSQATIAAVRGGIFLERPARVLMQLPFRPPFFDPNGAIRHEVSIYPDGQDAVVTIMLFSSICVTLALPHYGTRTALRYTQLLDGSGPQLFSIEPIPIPREPLSERDWDQLFAVASENIERIFHGRQQRDIEEIAQSAARVALGEASRTIAYGAFFTFFRAELERVPLGAEIINDLVKQARGHVAAGRVPFDESKMLLR